MAPAQAVSATDRARVADEVWMERFVACFEALARRLEGGGSDATQHHDLHRRGDGALHLVIDAAEGATRDGSLATDLSLPARPDRDEDFDAIRELHFRDHDVLLLFDASLDGIEAPDSALMSTACSPTCVARAPDDPGSQAGVRSARWRDDRRDRCRSGCPTPHPGLFGRCFDPVLAVVGLKRVVSRSCPVLGAVGGGMALVGWALLPFLVVGDAVAYEMSRLDPGSSQFAQLWDRLQATPAIVVFTAVFVVAHVFGTALLGIGLGRGRLVPPWAAVAVVVGSLLHPVAIMVFVNRPLVLLAHTLTIAGLVPAAAAALRMSDDEWDLRPTAG